METLVIEELTVDASVNQSTDDVGLVTAGYRSASGAVDELLAVLVVFATGAAPGFQPLRSARLRR